MISVKSLRMRVLEGPGESWRLVDQHLVRRGVVLALPHRASFAESRPGSTRLAVAFDGSGPRAAFAFEVRSPRALPGHQAWRVARLGTNGDPRALVQLLAWLRNAATDHGRVLWLDIEAFSLEARELRQLEAILAALRFEPAPAPEGYRRTRVLDLTRDEPTMLASMTAMGRRNLRKLSRLPYRVAPVVEAASVEAMRALVVETRRRTGGPIPHRSLAELVALAERHPDLARVEGLFDAEGRLVAFASGQWQGDHVSYGDGASTRVGPGVPLGYGPIWGLVGWARVRGARRFDLGGVSGDETHEGDALAGIDAFKRQLGGAEQTVSSEWRHLAAPVRSRFVRTVGRALGRNDDGK
jgi:hypothetical protein